MVRVLATAVIGWLCVGCGAHAGGAVRGAETAVVASPLVGSLEVAVAGDSALLTLHATNPGPEAVRLEFASAQRYDFEVWTLSGKRLWRWSEGRAFAQVVSEETLAAGSTLRERVAWPGSVAPGEYVAVGRLETLTAPLELRARFRVPVE